MGAPSDVIVKTDRLCKWFPVRRSALQYLRREGIFIKAVDDVNLDVRRGEVFALVGESGSGKTTFGKLLVKLLEPTFGTILFDGKDVSTLSKDELLEFHGKSQMIFQDPYESLNPRLTVFDLLVEPLRIQRRVKSFEEEVAAVTKALEDTGLVPPEEFYLRYPHQLSGGQRQRVAIARALVLNPKLIVADEPVSMIDVSIRAGILNLLLDLKDKFDITVVYITHDIATARHISDRVAVMYLGKLAEVGPIDDVVSEPLHPYTEALMKAVPDPDPEAKRAEVVLKGEIPTPINPPPGCRFRGRCPRAFDKCKEDVKPIEIGKDRLIYCHLYA